MFIILFCLNELKYFLFRIFNRMVIILIYLLQKKLFGEFKVVIFDTNLTTPLIFSLRIVSAELFISNVSLMKLQTDKNWETSKNCTMLTSCQNARQNKSNYYNKENEKKIE